MSKRSVILGHHYEEVAFSFLKQKGLSCLACNYRCRYGEIDWIGRDQNYLVFVEIKYRHTGSLVSPLESVDYFKQQKLLRTAEHYLQNHAGSGRLELRFDLILISDHPSTPLEWIQNVDIGYE